MSAMNITGQGHQVVYLPVSAFAVAGDTIVIPADTVVPGDGAKKRRIRVFTLVLVAKAAVNVTFKSNTTAISGVIPLIANQILPLIGQPSAHFLETAPGEGFVITTSADGVYGFVGFTLEDAR